MSPLETAKAFDAPIMKEADSSAPAKALLNQVGGKPVKYGLVNDGAGFDTEVPLPYTESGFRDSPYNQTSHTHSGSLLRKFSGYNNISGSDIEMSTRTGSSMPAGAHLELADPKRVTTL